MKHIALACAALALAATPLLAQSDKPGMKLDKAGNNAADSANSAAIAKDPGEVKAQ